MKNIIKYLMYYDNLIEYEEKKSKIDTKIIYTIPPYQYNRIYAYPRRYVQ